ncbi:MAG: ATP synthase F0 subunit C [Bryobacteraceae bacterium]
MRILKMMLFLAVLFLVASPVMAADGGVTGAIKDWKFATAGIGMAIASGLCGLAQGKAVAGATEAMARNPGAAAGIRFALILGLVLIESLALYTLVIILVV